MRRFIPVYALGLFCMVACGGRRGHGPGGRDSVTFTVDTAQIKQMDSLAVIQRRSDSELLKNANGTPGYNARLDSLDIRTPAGWRRNDTLLGHIRALMLDTASPNPRFRTNVNIVSDSLQGRSIDDYLRGTVNSLALYVPRFSPIGHGKRVFGTRSARWLHYTQDRDGTQLENICYLIPDRGIVYIVTCSALKGRLLQNRPAFESVIASFAIR